MEVPPKEPEQGSRAPEGLLQLPVTPFNNTNKMDFGTWGEDAAEPVTILETLSSRIPEVEASRLEP